MFERYRDADAALEHFANISHLIAPLVEAQIPGNLTSIMIPALRHFQRLRALARHAVHEPMLAINRRDHQPDSLLPSGSGLPVPRNGSRRHSFTSALIRAAVFGSSSCHNT